MALAPLVLAHRGANRQAPENTLAAFAAARAAGADGVELDVRRTSDDVLVVRHDAHIEGFGVLRGRSYADLVAEHPDVPTLRAALEELRGLLVNVEVKCLPHEPDADPDHVVARAAVDLVAELGMGPSVILSSFDLGAVDVVRAHAPEIVTAWLTFGQPVEQAAPLAAAHGHPWLHPYHGDLALDPDAAVAAARTAGVRLDVWTVNDPDEIRRLVAAGVDGVITDVPDVARVALGDAQGTTSVSESGS